MPRTVVTLILAWSTLLPPGVCTCAHGGASETDAADAADCRGGHGPEDARHDDHGPPAAAPAVPPCGGHEPGCLALRVPPDRSVRRGDGQPVDLPPPDLGRPMPPDAAGCRPPALLTHDPPMAAGRPLYLSLRTLLI